MIRPKKLVKHTPGAFGSRYNHEVISAMREKNSRLQLLVMAMIDHYQVKQEELDDIMQKYTAKMIAEAEDKSLENNS